jgi:hypothetical protein
MQLSSLPKTRTLSSYGAPLAKDYNLRLSEQFAKRSCERDPKMPPTSAQWLVWDQYGKLVQNAQMAVSFFSPRPADSRYFTSIEMLHSLFPNPTDL